MRAPWIECHFGHELENGDDVVCLDCFKDIVEEKQQLSEKLHDQRNIVSALSQEIRELEMKIETLERHDTQQAI